jgi:hypothetical protein
MNKGKRYSASEKAFESLLVEAFGSGLEEAFESAFEKAFASALEKVSKGHWPVDDRLEWARARPMDRKPNRRN